MLFYHCSYYTKKINKQDRKTSIRITLHNYKSIRPASSGYAKLYISAYPATAEYCFNNRAYVHQWRISPQLADVRKVERVYRYIGVSGQSTGREKTTCPLFLSLLLAWDRLILSESESRLTCAPARATAL